MRARVVAGCAAAAAIIFFYWPRERSLRVDRLSEVRAPEAPPEYPHPFEQLVPDGSGRLFVSPFVDLGGRSWLLGAHATSPGRLLVRSAQRERAFRIRQPRPEDRESLAWRPAAPGMSLRRFAQLAVVVEPGAATTAAESRIDLATRPDGAPWFPLAIAAGLLLAVPRLARSLPALGDALGRRWGLALLALLMTATVALLWQRKWVDADELDIVGQARKMLVEKRSAPELFNYPPALVYLHAGASIAGGVLGAVSGAAAFHDPYTNQLFLHGAPTRFERALGPDDIAIDFFDESTAVLRRLYALAGPGSARGRRGARQR